MKDKQKELSTIKNSNLEKEDVFPESSEQGFQNFVRNSKNEKSYVRYMDKPYQEAKKNRHYVAWLGSYFLQLCGALLATFAFFKLLTFILPSFPYAEVLALIITSLLLLLLELSKRYLWNDLFTEKNKTGKIPLGLLMISLILLGISTSSSTIGAYLITFELTDSTQIVQNQSNLELSAIENNYNQKITDYEQRIKTIEQQVQSKIQKGQLFTTPASEQKKIDFYASQIQQYQAERDRKTQKLEDNTGIHITDMESKAWNYASAGFGLSLLFEFLAIVCIYYLAYYDFRVFVETQALRKNEKNTIAKESNLPSDVAQYLQHLEEQLHHYTQNEQLAINNAPTSSNKEVKGFEYQQETNKAKDFQVQKDQDIEVMRSINFRDFDFNSNRQRHSYQAIVPLLKDYYLHKDTEGAFRLQDIATRTGYSLSTVYTVKREFDKMLDIRNKLIETPHS